jgi:riboflavin transporter FmnP
MKKTLFTTQNLVRIAMLAALGTVLYFVAEIPIIPGAEHLKIDLSTIPALIGSIIITPLAGVVILLIQNLLHLFKTTTLGIGELGNNLWVSPLCLVSRFFMYSQKILPSVSFAFLADCALLGVWACGITYLSSRSIWRHRQPQLPLGAFVAYLISTITLNVVNRHPCCRLPHHQAAGKNESLP